MKQDLRYKKTEELIQQSFFELMSEIGLKKISVAMIVERANINRSTFYAHYIDKFDLLEKVENQLLDEWYFIGKTVSTEVFTNPNHNTTMLEHYIKNCIQYLCNYGHQFSILMGENGDPAFTTYFSHKISELIQEIAVTHSHIIPDNYFVAACTGILTNLLAEWVKSDFKQTPEEFLEILRAFMGSVFS